MRILFTPVGDTDPVRGGRDGAMLHILRYYDVGHVIVVLTKEMEAKEDATGCYSKGIESFSDKKITYEFIRTGITEPQKYEALTVVQDAFEEAYQAHPDAEWLVNISSGTPQLKTLMALFALDYPHTKAIQVDSPKRRSNTVGDNAACKTSDLVEMLAHNEDNEAGAENRCSEPPLYLLRRHGLVRQITSLVRNYEYAGALQILQENRDCGFAEETEKLLQHAVYRRDLMWKEANKVISRYEDKPLSDSPDDFSEYFQVMEMRLKKKQYPEFIVKLSPVLMNLGMKYLKGLYRRFDLKKCGYTDKKNEKNKVFYLQRTRIEKYYPKLRECIENELNKKFRDGPIYFSNIVWICNYLKEHECKGDRHHENVTAIFEKLRIVEERTRNPVAHKITNLTDENIRELTKQSDEKSQGIPEGLSAEDIMKLLHRAVSLIRKRDIQWSYDKLNDIIISSLKKRKEEPAPESSGTQEIHEEQVISE